MGDKDKTVCVTGASGTPHAQGQGEDGGGILLPDAGKHETVQILVLRHALHFFRETDKTRVTCVITLLCSCLLAPAGFLACYVIKELLDRGYTVRGTVRDASNAKKTQHIQQLVRYS